MAEASNDVGGEHEKREEPEVSMDTQEVELQDSDNMSAAVCTETKYDKVLNAMDRMELIAFAKKTLTENPSARIHLPKPFRLEHKRGDLFECEKTESLAHCVSEDMRMGKGIAVIFKKKFGGVKELKAQAYNPSLERAQRSCSSEGS